MSESARYLLVDSRVLPEVFRRVVQAKQLLKQGKAKNLSDASRMAGISRSAFYKYRDSVFAYEQDGARRIATLHANLLDEAGVLSSLLAELYGIGANILTINQSIPVDGVAPVSITIRTDCLTRGLTDWMTGVRGLYGLVDIKILNG